MKYGLYPANLKDHDGRKMYCGRFALIAATGKTSRQVTRAINRCREFPLNRTVGATSTTELRRALGHMKVGFSSEYVAQRSKQPTFAQWIKKEQHSRKAVYILLITGHWIAVRGDWLSDTRHVTPHDLSIKNPYARKRVQCVIHLA